MKTQAVENLVQLLHGCCLSHFNLRRRHSRHDVMMRFRRRMPLGALLSRLSAGGGGDGPVRDGAGGDVVGKRPAILGIVDTYCRQCV